LARLLARFGFRSDREYVVGPYRLAIPDDHRIGDIRRKWKRYDVALGDIARAVAGKYPAATAIDIGANVGDSAALIRMHQTMPVLCIEGNPEFLPWLRRNLEVLGENVEIEPCFVADDESGIVPSDIETAGGTASVNRAVRAGTPDGSIRTRSLGSIVREHPRFSDPRLLKVDTDGLDFRILRLSRGFLADARPVIFFEYYLDADDGAAGEALAAVESLASIGYHRHLVYDNFGNFLVSIDAVERFAELNAYLASNRRHGRAVYYFDVCSFHDVDTDLCEQIRRHEILLAAE
jgi:FkbM family methyltransferase